MTSASESVLDAEEGRFHMAHIYEKVLSLITKPPEERPDNELEDVVPWFKKKAEKLFKDVKNRIIQEIVKYSEFRICRNDDVIIRQGEKGDEFYIVLNGSAGIHINSNLAEEEVEIVHRKQLQEEASAKLDKHGRPLDRSLYGIHVGVVGTGKSFGELALINPESIRNATIIANDPCELLVVSRDLYNKTLHAFQAREFAEKQKFVQDFPLFHKWNARYRKMAAMSLVKHIVKFEDVIVKQGMPIDGLYFLVSGHVKIRIDPSHHPLQYPQHFPVGNIAELERQKARELLRKEMNLESHRNTGKKSTYERRTLPQQDAKKITHRPFDLCLMGAVDTIGDIEMILNLSSHSQTVICMEESTIFHLDQKNYDRLVEKRNPQALDIMKDIVHTKLALHFQRLSDETIPLFRFILYTMDESERETNLKQQQQQLMAKGRTATWATATNETAWQINHLQRGPLVNLYGPGSVFYLIRQKTKERRLQQERALKAAANNTSAAFRFSHQPQNNVLARTPLADNSRFLYADDTASIASDGHIVNIYGYNENKLPVIVNEDGEVIYDDELAGGNAQDEYADDDGDKKEDWATNDVALSKLEERLVRWHTSLDTASTTQPTTSEFSARDVPVVVASSQGNKTLVHSVVKLHRFHAAEENKPKPGNKVFLRERNKYKQGEEQNGLVSVTPVPDGNVNAISPAPRTPVPSDKFIDSNANHISGVESQEPSKTQRTGRSCSAGQLWGSKSSAKSKKQSKPRHQYTVEEYQALKEELKRRQREYRSFLSQRSNTVVF